MSVVVTERAIEDERFRSSVKVRTTGAGRVMVEWYCGDLFHFDVDALREHLVHIRTVARAGVSAWYDGEDAHGKPFRVRLHGDDLTAENSSERVDFSDLRRAIKLTVKGLK